ncbi:Hypothetical_protein [Hexamita inflata]|uniref:Hypothetical_protein n=1 Tax=Hexamita inflata TaxID=28002 RepID=A0AA86QX85_9EUKA|nr:Hypothetical protein HINF_LOCUS50576 [Hexamita inflata]
MSNKLNPLGFILCIVQIRQNYLVFNINQSYRDQTFKLQSVLHVVNILCASDVVKQQNQIILIRKKTLFPALNLETLHVAADTLVHIHLQFISKSMQQYLVIEYTLLQNTQFQSLS